MLENLNPEQKKAVETTNHATLVLSGAGTGKTRVLTVRIAYILSHGLAMPWQIMALTFTNKAAREIRERVAQIVPNMANDIWMGTFHSIALRILRFNAERVGLRNDFLIFDDNDQKRVVKGILEKLNMDAKDANVGDWIDKISAVKDKGLGYTPNVGVKKIYDVYNIELARLNAVDFGDIILKVLELFDTAPDMLAKYQNQFKYILVDEYQDTNGAQNQFIHMLYTRENYIFCVGDDDQSIYSWRGAEIEHILNFKQRYSEPYIVIDINYRSTGNILGAANSLIRHNANRLGKELRPMPNVGMGRPVDIIILPTDWDEARMIANAITHDATGGNFSDFAVLIRSGSLSRNIEEEFKSHGIPYRLVGDTKFYDRREIRDVVAYTRLLVHRFDDLSFLRVIAAPRRGFGDVAIAKMCGNGETLMNAMYTTVWTPRLRVVADEFLGAFDFNWDAMRPSDAVEQLLNSVGYFKMWQESKEPNAPERINNVNDLLRNVISKYDNLGDFLEHAALMMTDDDDNTDITARNLVSIMTIHAAKGLEFDTVFLPAWEENIIPNKMAVEDLNIEEERRLAYVAITRARVHLIISNAMSRMQFGERKSTQPSQFIAEIDPAFTSIRGVMPQSYRPVNQIPTSYSRPAARPVVQSTSLVGKLAFHAEMGQGVIIEENDDILTVAFRNHGIKKVARDFIKAG